MVYHDGEGPEEAEDDELSSADEGEDDAALDDEADLDADDADLDGESSGAKRGSRRQRLERMLPEILKRAIERGLETGIGTFTNSGEALRGVVNKAEVPKEVAHYVLGQVDETKNAMVRVVAREVREFLQAADLAQELQRALTSLSFEIRTEIRFIPNDAGGVTPDVKASVGPRVGDEANRRRRRRPSSMPGHEPDEDED